ncbi:hydroxyacylglutathione hydrolase [Celerinatantimonas yamalensis]|uniref:Hydroxyacylglutathione hydrolase n=1 Tax=Celerinatantimonas yamalensis TaxID=559956 RepID=A0ABW9GB01_9GAMM
MQIMTIPAFNDNYIWLLHHLEQSACAVIDPGQAEPILARLTQLGSSLHYILLTHHHLDHIGGVQQLLQHYPDCQVIAGADIPLPFSATRVKHTDQLKLANIDCTLKVMATPGHTLSHVVYYNDDYLFCGDTLFNCGCGRLFEGTAEQMLQSLKAIATLNPNINVYAAHEYTLANLKFALAIEPTNPALLEYHKQMVKLRQQGLPTIPFQLSSQLAFNPFMRCDNKSLQSALSAILSTPCVDEIEAFRQLRLYKDRF